MRDSAVEIQSRTYLYETTDTCSLSASEIGSAGTVWITCKLGVSLEVDCALVAERYEGRGRV